MPLRFGVLAFLLSAAAHAQITVVNAASFRGDQPVAAGSWAGAFGTFPGVTTTTAVSFPLQKTLAGVKVTIDNVDAPVYFVRNDFISFLVPYATPAGVRTIQITTPSTTVNGTMRVISAAPGLFTKDTQSPPRGAVRNTDQSENSASSQAKRGDTISIYGTGPSTLDRQLQDGVAPGFDPLARTKSAPQVFIGGVAADIQFSGINPDVPGLWQINAVIPDRAFIKGRVAVQVFIDGVDSNEVAIYVQ
jgi:uncharacterized protein (TIGR03437 family)